MGKGKGANLKYQGLGGSGAADTRTAWSHHKRVIMSKDGKIVGNAPFQNLQEVIDYLDQPKIECLECGRMLGSMAAHINRVHDLTGDQYKKKYNVPLHYPLASKTTRQKLKNNAQDQWDSGSMERVRENLSDLGKRSTKGHKYKTKSSPFARNKTKAKCLTCGKIFIRIYSEHSHCSLKCGHRKPISTLERMLKPFLGEVLAAKGRLEITKDRWYLGNKVVKYNLGTLSSKHGDFGAFKTVILHSHITLKDVEGLRYKSQGDPKSTQRSTMVEIFKANPRRVFTPRDLVDKVEKQFGVRPLQSSMTTHVRSFLEAGLINKVKHGHYQLKEKV